MKTKQTIFIPNINKSMSFYDLSEQKVQYFLKSLKLEGANTVFCKCNGDEPSTAPQMFTRQIPGSKELTLVLYPNSPPHSPNCPRHNPYFKSFNEQIILNVTTTSNFDTLDFNRVDNSNNFNSPIYKLAESLLIKSHNDLTLLKKSPNKLNNHIKHVYSSGISKNITLGFHNKSPIYCSDIIFNPTFISKKNNFDFSNTIKNYIYKLNGSLSSGKSKLLCYTFLKYDSYTNYDNFTVRVKLLNPLNASSYCYIYMNKSIFLKKLSSVKHLEDFGTSIFISSTLSVNNNYLSPVELAFIAVHDKAFVPITNFDNYKFISELIGDSSNSIRFLMNTLKCPIMNDTFSRYKPTYIILSKQLEPVVICDVFTGTSKRELLQTQKKFDYLINQCSKTDNIEFLGYFPNLDLDLPTKQLNIIRYGFDLSVSDRSITAISKIISRKLNLL